MAAPLLLFWFCIFVFLQKPLSCNGGLQKTNLFRSLNVSQQHTQLSEKPKSPARFFEVTAPIKRPPTQPCSLRVLHHDFANTYNKPPATAGYKPPAHCSSQTFSKIILEWSATCKGRQFDRIFGVWLGGVELFRSCTAEPIATGIVWTIEKDITRFSSLLKKPQTLAVHLANIVDQTYTGVYHVDIWFHFYPASGEETHRGFTADSACRFDFPADLIVPISKNPPLNDALWFVINNNSDFQAKEFKIPRNAYRAVLEVFVSFHGDDEFWYGNPPQEYIIANNITDLPGNGAFREVVVSLDGKVVGAVWPSPVVYTGGINPLLWRPITGIGSFDLPSYNIEITPFLGLLLDGKRHKFGFSVANSLDMWYVDANLHLWLDRKSKKTVAKLISHSSKPTMSNLISSIAGLNGIFHTTATRVVTSDGWVKTSKGKMEVHSQSRFEYSNGMLFQENGNVQVVNQTIKFLSDATFKYPSFGEYITHLFRKFPIDIYMKDVEQGDGSFSSLADISMGFAEERVSGLRPHTSISSVVNIQHGQGEMVVKKNLVQRGLGSTQQQYEYNSEEGCYYRDVSSRNYTILHDKSSERCRRDKKFGSGFKFHRQQPSGAKGLGSKFIG